MRPTLLVLWLVVALLAAGITAATMWPRHGKRDDVTAYIRQVNGVSRSFSGRYKAVDKAFRTFSFAPAQSARQLPRVRAAARELTRLRRRIEAVPAPPAAATLRRRLIAFFRQQEAVGWELVAVSGYVPRLAAVERPLAPASTRMRAALKKGSTAKSQAAALRSYADVVDGAAETLSAIHAPPLFATSQSRQVSRLRGSAAAVRRLAAAIAGNDRKAVQKAIDELARTPTASSAAAATAVAAYNRRVDRIRVLARSVELERRRLGEKLG
ncbi:MAG TPA: hypothetical protein VIU86_05980 [Gaiellaceae bacterium]